MLMSLMTTQSLDTINLMMNNEGDRLSYSESDYYAEENLMAWFM